MSNKKSNKKGEIAFEYIIMLTILCMLIGFCMLLIGDFVNYTDKTIKTANKSIDSISNSNSNSNSNSKIQKNNNTLKLIKKPKKTNKNVLKINFVILLILIATIIYMVLKTYSYYKFINSKEKILNKYCSISTIEYYWEY